MSFSVNNILYMYIFPDIIPFVRLPSSGMTMTF